MMTIKRLIRTVTTLAISGIMLSASANSVGYDSTGFQSNGVPGQVSITVVYDFTDFAMFGGGLDIVYDPSAIEFVSYTQAPLQDDAQSPASPEGSFQFPGSYTNFGVGTFDIFSGMSSAGELGTFTFNILDLSSSENTPCGQTICLVENNINAFVSFAGAGVGAELLANGTSGANVPLTIVTPIPAAVWFMLSGLIALLGIGRKSVQG